MVDASGAIRAAAVAPSLLLAPGLAWTGLAGVRSVMVELLLAVVLSLAIETLAGVALAAVGAWSPGSMLAATAAVTAAGLASSVWRARAESIGGGDSS